MTQNDEHVYADVSAQRLVVPGLVALVMALILIGLGVRQVMAGNDDRSPDDLALPAESTITTVYDPQVDANVVLERFVEALRRQDLNLQQFAFGTSAEADDDLATLVAKLDLAQINPKAGTAEILDSTTASAPLTTEWTLADGTEFVTEGAVELRRVGSQWLVDWEPSVLESSLDPGDVLVQERVVAPRAPILGARDEVLVGDRPVVEIGVVPRRSTDIPTLARLLGAALDIDPADIEAAIAPSPSDSVVAIATRSPAQADAVRQQMAAYPAVVFEETTFTQSIDERFARALLGRAAEVTAEIIDEHPDLFIPGDIVGRSGLQREYNAQLAGQPGYQIRVERRFATTFDPAAGETDPDIIYLEAPVEGEPLRLTLDARVQRAAENALSGTKRNSALVAIQPSTGHILAVANGPGAAVTNLALTGRYPPGSIFKTVTAYAAMANGADAEEPVDCPLDLVVNGRRFTNAEGEVLGMVPLREAYVRSCNTAFINLANSFVEPSDFARYGAAFGLGVPYELGTWASSGSIPTPSGSVDIAATSFGQAELLVSPLSGAVMASTAASGTYRPPVLVLPSANAEPNPVGAGSAASATTASTDQTNDDAALGEAAEVTIDQPLDPTLVPALQQMMREVVTSGTGRALSNVAGGPVSGKTGTAEFGSGDPPPAHAWFVGFQGDLAFAVFVEGGEFGGSTAGPIAADFLNRLAG